HDRDPSLDRKPLDPRDLLGKRGPYRTSSVDEVVRHDCGRAAAYHAPPDNDAVAIDWVLRGVVAGTSPAPCLELLERPFIAQRSNPRPSTQCPGRARALHGPRSDRHATTNKPMSDPDSTVSPSLTSCRAMNPCEGANMEASPTDAIASPCE